MSGGVDSSVTAALLKHAGYDVVGVTLQLYDHGAALKKQGACCAGQDIHDARRVAEALGVPHYVLDYESRFRASVMEEFADAYLKGATPIPCVRCNQTVKFKDLLETARDLGAEAMATGHYIRRTRDAEGRAQLARAADPDKDQSYFLFATTRAQLDFLRFLLGRHEGVIRFTVGQRRGLGVAAGEPLFVVRIDAARREVVVGPREALATRALALAEANWLGEDTLEAACAQGRTAFARVRSTRPPTPGRMAMVDGSPGFVFDAPEEGVAPGQACVLYSAPDADIVLGGGFIAETVAAGL